MKLKFAGWIFLAAVAIALPAAGDQATVSSTASTNKSATVSTNVPSSTNGTNTVNATNAPSGTNAVAEAKVPEDIYTNSIDMVLIKLPGGFWAGEYEVTQKEYQKIMGSNPSAFGGDTRPVDSVSWNDAVDFCAKLTTYELETNAVPKDFYYTLPTEDEWESLVADATLDNAVTSQNGASRGGTSPVGSLRPNSLGLYDVRGNVMEFCLTDTSKPYRVVHGGSWQDSIEQNLRPEFRFYCTPEESKNTFGFRVLLKHK